MSGRLVPLLVVLAFTLAACGAGVLEEAASPLESSPWHLVSEFSPQAIDITATRDGSLFRTTSDQLYSSRDGGQTWLAVPLEHPAGAELKNIDAAGAALVLARELWSDEDRQKAEVLVSTDAGANWRTSLELGKDQAVLAVTTLAPGRVWVLVAPHLGSKGETRVLYHSADLGRSWRRLASWRVEEGGTWIEDSLAFVSPTTGWALGVADYYDQAPLITRDGGRHWSAVASPHASADRVVPVGPALAWLVGDNTDEQAYRGTLQRTTDAGGSWTEDPRFGSVPLYDASWMSPARGWLFGDGAIYATTDGGRNWAKDFETRDADASFTQATRTADSVFALGWDAAAERSVLYARRLSP